jgi:hypothetical protein
VWLPTDNNCFYKQYRDILGNEEHMLGKWADSFHGLLDEGQLEQDIM